MTRYCPACDLAGRRTEMVECEDIPSWYNCPAGWTPLWCVHCESVTVVLRPTPGQLPLFD